MGDNITPPQQAFNWVADVYGSTDEIKARGQVIVGLLHENVGHLGHLRLRQGREEGARADRLGAEVDRGAAARPLRHEDQGEQGADGKVEYEVEFASGGWRRSSGGSTASNASTRSRSRRSRAAEFNQRAYELFAQPLVQAMANEDAAKRRARIPPAARRAMGGVRPQSLAALARPAAEAVKAQRQAADAGQPVRKVEALVSEAGERLARLLPRDPRCGQRGRCSSRPTAICSRSTSPTRQARAGAARPQAGRRARAAGGASEALASIAKGGYAEALARTAALLAQRGRAVPARALELKEELLAEYQGTCCRTSPRDEWRRIRGEQDIIVRYEPEQALETLPGLLADRPTASACWRSSRSCSPTSGS